MFIYVILFGIGIPTLLTSTLTIHSCMNIILLKVVKQINIFVGKNIT